MKRTILVIVALAVAAGSGAIAYQTVAQQRQYRTYVARGDAAAAAGETFGAIEAYSGAIALRPDSMLAHLRRGESYQQRGELDAAARDFRVAAGLDPTATRPLEALGDLQFQRQRFARAVDAYKAYLTLDDRSPTVTYKLALARYRSGEIDRAMAELTKAVALDERMPHAYYLLGLCLRERNQPAAAAEALERAIALSPTLIPAREELADLYVSTGRQADAIEQLQLIAGLDRTHVDRQVALGLAQARAGRVELAVLTLASALERSPDQPQVYRALGQVWLESAPGRSDALSKALEALQRVAASGAASSEALTLYGRALARAEDLESAERVLQQAVRRFPVDPAAYLHFADVAERRGHFDAARAALLEYGTLATDEGDAAARAATIGRLSLRLNEPHEARRWLERAVVANPRDLRLAAMLADAQWRAGDRDSASATIARGLEQDPGDAELRTLARRLRLPLPPEPSVSRGVFSGR